MMRRVRYAVKFAETRLVRKVVEGRSVQEARFAALSRYQSRSKLNKPIGVVIVSVEPIRAARRAGKRVQTAG